MGTRIACLVGLALLTVPHALVAQRPAPRDTVVEVLGLNEWTVADVQRSLERLRPGISLADAACAVLLRDSLGFMRAAVETWSFPDRVWTTLTVVEPQDSARIRPLPVRSDSLPDRPEWKTAIELVRVNPGVLSPLQRYDFFRGRTDSVFGQPADSATLAFRDRIGELAETADYERLVWTVTHDRNRFNRLIATLLLGHFPERDRTWRTLMRGLRDRYGIPGGMDEMILVGMAREDRYRVDWTPVEDDLHYLLAGTNLFAFLDVLTVLAYTGLEPEAARRVIPSGQDLIVSNLRSKNPSRRRQLRFFLSRVSGEDFGEDSEAWVRWVRSVSSESAAK